MDLSTFRERFEPHLRRFLLKKTEGLHAYTSNTMMRALFAEPARLLAAGGKRIRPMLCVAGYELGGGRDPELALRSSVALELFHLFALIHDDIMDRGEERHGVSTSHRFIERLLREAGREGDLAHVGVSQAIIVGDLLLAWAMEALNGSGGSMEALNRQRRVFCTMTDEVMVGQMLDIDLTTRAHATHDELVQKMALKTAGYTFVRPLEMGLALAESRDEELHVFARDFGESLGIAFQILDDLLDAFGTVEEIGKTPLSDIRDHQHSCLTHWVLERGTEVQRADLAEIWGKKTASEEEVMRLRQTFARSGALDESLRQCCMYRDRARAALGKITLSGELGLFFGEIIEKAVPETRLNRLYEYLCL